MYFPQFSLNIVFGDASFSENHKKSCLGCILIYKTIKKRVLGCTFHQKSIENHVLGYIKKSIKIVLWDVSF